MLPLKSLIHAGMLTICISAWKIPKVFEPGPRTDGKYAVYINHTGELIYERLDTDHFYSEIKHKIDQKKEDPSQHTLQDHEPVRETNRSLKKRERGWAVHCWCNQKLDHEHSEKAAKGLINLCKYGCESLNKTAIWSISGNVIAFACPGEQTNYHQFTSSFEKITDRCGQDVMGSSYSEGIFYGPVVGIMRWRPGVEVCEVALDSVRHKC